MFKTNREAIFSQMADQSVAVLFSGKAPHKSGDSNYDFEVNRNFYFLTGIDQEDVILLLVKGAKQQSSILFLEPIDPVMALWVGEGLTKEKAIETSKVDTVLDRKDFDTIISKYFQDSRHAIYGAIHNLYLDLDRRELKQPFMLSNEFGNTMKNAYPNLLIQTIHPLLGELRSVKNACEIEETKVAIEITKSGIESLMSHAQSGIKEYALEAHYHFVLNSNGVLPSFNTIAASGKNATILHYEKNDAVIEKDALILFDLGVRYHHYCSDITRTFPVSGKFTDRQKQIYNIVLEANQKSIEFLKPGVTFQEWNAYGKKILADGLMRIGKISDPAEVTKYYYHSLGHFLGLDVHDVGNYTKPFEVGQILTVEPGLYIADEGIGIRIEDNVLITQDGRINLSAGIIKTVEQIETLMKK